MGTTIILMTFCLVEIDIGYREKNKSYGEINIPFNENDISSSFSAHPITLSDAMQPLGQSRQAPIKRGA